MSRVTIESLYSDFTVPRKEAREYGMNYEQYAHLAVTEIVPRVIVEMIIDKCSQDEELYSKLDRIEAATASHDVKEYAETLLKQFERDDE